MKNVVGLRCIFCLFMHRSTYGIGLLMLGFFLFKVLRFQRMGYTFNDMYAFVQMSHSWMDGRPFMYENVWGYHHRIHNYYTVLLWGPLTRLFGAYGLFAAQAGLLTIAYGAVNERLARSNVPNRMRYLVLVVVLLGPVSFWLNDHPNIGWHTELTYLPLALLFALALLAGNALAIGLAGLAVVLVKEDGAVLAALIQLAYEGLRVLNSPSRRSLGNLLFQRRFWLILAGWILVFSAGMLWLRLKNNAPEPRLQMAFQLLQSHVGTVAFWRQILTLTGQTVLLLLPVAGVLLVVIPGIRRAAIGRVLLLWIVGVLVLTALNFIQSVHYFGQPLFYLVSLTWPPRFVLVWAFSAAFLVLMLSLFANRLQPVQAPGLSIAGGVLFLVQLPVLYLARPDFLSPRDWWRLAKGQYEQSKPLAYLQPDDLSRARCIADLLPATANVFAYDLMVPIFHRQYEIWPTGKQFQPADVAIVPTDMKALQARIPMRKPYQTIRLKAYNLYVTDRMKALLTPCIPPNRP